MAQKIWRANVKKCKQSIRQKKAKHRPSTTTTTTQQILLDEINQVRQSESLSNDLFTPSMCTIIQERLVHIHRRAEALMKFKATIEDSKLFR